MSERNNPTRAFDWHVLVVLYVGAIILLTISTISAGTNLHDYREDIAGKYGIKCSWYEEVIFRNKDKRLNHNDSAGSFITKRNRFDLMDKWSGDGVAIGADEMAKFNELNNALSSNIYWLAIILGPCAFLFCICAVQASK